MKKYESLVDFIIQKYVESKEDTIKVYNYYEEAIELKLTKASKKTFERYVRNTIHNYQNDKLPEDYLKYKSQYLNIQDELKKAKNELNELHKQGYNYKTIIDGLNELTTKIQPDNINLNININIKNKNRLNNITPISDLHFGEIVIPSHVMGLNKYNIEIAKQRFLKYFVENIKVCKYTGADIWYLLFIGDLLSGNIHEDLRETNEKPILVCLMELYKFIVGFIEDYSKNFDKVVIRGVVGNHPRLDKKKKIKNKVQDNYEYILFKMIEDYFAGNNKIDIKVSECEFDIVQIDEQKAYICHGDTFRGGNNFLGLPAQTVSRDSLRDYEIFREIKEEFDFMILGHFHSASFVYPLGSKPIIFNPSIVGITEMSIAVHKYFPQSQWSLVTDEKDFKVSRLIKL